MGISDFFVCFCLLIMRGFSSIRSEDITDFGSYLIPFVVPFAMIIITNEIWLIVFVSAERYLAICRKTRINFKKVYYVIGFILLFAILINIGMFWFYGVSRNINMDLVCNDTFYFWANALPALLIRFLLPFIILLFTSILTIKEASTYE